jgi:hypothetical protein
MSFQTPIKSRVSYECSVELQRFITISLFSLDFSTKKKKKKKKIQVKTVSVKKPQSAINLVKGVSMVSYCR